MADIFVSYAREDRDWVAELTRRLEHVQLPIEFSSTHTADLSGLDADPTHAGFAEVVQAIQARLRGDEAIRPVTYAADRKRVMRSGPRAWLVAAALAVVGAAVLYSSARRSVAGDAAESTQADLPNFTYGSWTLYDATDSNGAQWSNSVLKFDRQQPTPDGLAVHGTFTWRSDNLTVGSEVVTGSYLSGTRQLFLEGQTVTDVAGSQPSRLAVGSYSATLSQDVRALVDGHWGSTQTNEPGFPGRWSARR